jgi:hypothetical protein
MGQQAGKQKPLYGLRMNPRELDRIFYERFDTSFLFNKALTLMATIVGGDQFKQQVNAILQERGGGTLDDKYSDALRAELFFMVFHQFESFFVLLISPFQNLPDWIYLTAYKTDELKTSVEHFLNQNIRGITQGQCKDEQQFIATAVYGGSIPTDPELQAKWDENLDNISWLIHRIGHIYLDELKAYNSYKHGLRVMVGPSYFAMHLNTAASLGQGPGFTRSSENSLSYLEFEQQNGIKEVYEVTKHFDPEISFFYLTAMHQMLETIKTTRLAVLQNNISGQTLNTFFGLDKDHLISQNAQSEFKFSISL